MTTLILNLQNLAKNKEDKQWNKHLKSNNLDDLCDQNNVGVWSSRPFPCSFLESLMTNVLVSNNLFCDKDGMLSHHRPKSPSWTIDFRVLKTDWADASVCDTLRRERWTMSAGTNSVPGLCKIDGPHYLRHLCSKLVSNVLFLPDWCLPLTLNLRSSWCNYVTIWKEKSQITKHNTIPT